MLNKTAKAYFDQLDRDPQPLTLLGEQDITEELTKILNQDKDYVPSEEDRAEQFAFAFMAAARDDTVGRGTYYGPMYTLANDAGQVVEYPSIKSVTPDTLAYWEQRAHATTNPILVSRYADLVIDFSEQILNTTKIKIDLWWLVIDSNIAIYDRSLAEPLQCKTKLHRALVLALTIKNRSRVNHVARTIISFEEAISSDDSPGLWGFAFKWLLLDFHKQIKIDEEQRDRLINDMEERIHRIRNDPGLVEHGVSLLAEYYAAKDDEMNLLRILGIFEASVRAETLADPEPLVTISRYQQLVVMHQLFADRGFPKAETAKKKTIQHLGSLDLDWENSGSKVSVELDIKREDIDEFLFAVLGKNKRGKLEPVIAKFALHLLPKKEDVHKQFRENSKKYPFQAFASKFLIADNGLPVAQLKSLAEDVDNRFQEYAFHYLHLGGVFLAFAVTELKQRFSKREVTDYLKKAEFFKDEESEYLERALSAYWDDDHLVSSHLFIPMIEAAIRELVKRGGGRWLKPNNFNGYDLVPLSSLLQDDAFATVMRHVFQQFGEDVLFYLKLVLVEKLGMNLRNDFAHGMGKRKFFGQNASDRLFHIVILLSMVKKKMT